METSFKYASGNIKLLLKFKGWTHDVLCKKTGIHHMTLQRRLKHNSGWTLTEAVNISKAFGLSINEVFFTQMIPSGNAEKSA